MQVLLRLLQELHSTLLAAEVVRLPLVLGARRLGVDAHADAREVAVVAADAVLGDRARVGAAGRSAGGEEEQRENDRVSHGDSQKLSVMPKTTRTSVRSCSPLSP